MVSLLLYIHNQLASPEKTFPTSTPAVSVLAGSTEPEVLPNHLTVHKDSKNV